jgi:hypothetical protein
MSYLQTPCPDEKLYNNQEINCDHNTDRLVMSHLNNITVCRGDIFIKFKLLGPKTSAVLMLNVKTISSLGVRPGGTASVDVTRVNP